MARAEQLEEAIEARLSAERARTAAETALQTEMSWARSLDEMRVLVRASSCTQLYSHC